MRFRACKARWQKSRRLSVPKAFSRETLKKFEDASASIPLRALDRVFERTNIRLGDDPSEGLGGPRRTQFRRYVASIDQHDPEQSNRLGDALGALIGEVATSKEEFLVKAAERDGFFFADGTFRPTEIAAASFAVKGVEDLAFIDDRSRRLHLLANDNPQDATRGASELVESVCRTVLLSIGKPAPGKAAGLVAIAESTLEALALSPGIPRQLCAVVAALCETRNGLSPRHARLAAGAAVAFARFIAEPYVERAAPSAERRASQPVLLRRTTER
jgi:hypothetical protein